MRGRFFLFLLSKASTYCELGLPKTETPLHGVKCFHDNPGGYFFDEGKIFSSTEVIDLL
jgi:hypothetical protein